MSKANRLCVCEWWRDAQLTFPLLVMFRRLSNDPTANRRTHTLSTVHSKAPTKETQKKIHFAHANRRRIILVFVAIFFLLLCGSPSSSVCFDFHSIPECCVRSRWIFHQILLHRNTIEFNRREHTHTHTQAHRDNVSDGDTIRSKLNWTSFFANSHKVITNQLVTV